MASTYDGVRVIEALNQSEKFWDKQGAGYYDIYGNTNLEFDGSPSASREGSSARKGTSRYAETGRIETTGADASKVLATLKKRFFLLEHQTLESGDGEPLTKEENAMPNTPLPPSPTTPGNSPSSTLIQRREAGGRRDLARVRMESLAHLQSLPTLTPEQSAKMRAAIKAA